MRQIPDAWIERQDHDIYPPMTDEQLCEEGRCEHNLHCEECGLGMTAPFDGTPYCFSCVVWMMPLQLMYRPPAERYESFPSLLRSAEDERRLRR